MTQHELDQLNIMTVKNYNDVEKMRRELNRGTGAGRGGGGEFTQLALCQRTGINPSTFTKGLKAGARPTPTTLRQLRLVLEARRHVLLAEGAGDE